MAVIHNCGNALKFYLPLTKLVKEFKESHCFLEVNFMAINFKFLIQRIKDFLRVPLRLAISRSHIIVRNCKHHYSETLLPHFWQAPFLGIHLRATSNLKLKFHRWENIAEFIHFTFNFWNCLFHFKFIGLIIRMHKYSNSYHILLFQDVIPVWLLLIHLDWY